MKQIDFREIMSNVMNSAAMRTNDTEWLEFIQSPKRFHRHDECLPHHFVEEEYENNIRRNRIFDAVSFNLELIYPNKRIKSAAHNAMYYIPMKDITDSLWDLHGNPDCTHWCKTPYLFMFVWDSM